MDRLQSLRPIIDLLANAERSASELGYSDPKLRAAYDAQLLMILSAAYVEIFGTSVETPDWVPYLPGYLARAAPNPDTVYDFAPVVAEGVYRFTGVKGTETLATLTLRKGGAHLGVRSGARLDEIDLTSIESNADGSFSFMLSRSRPPDYVGQWFELHPETTCLMLRRVTKDASEVDGVCSIERLDRPAGATALSDAELAQRISTMAAYVARQTEFVLGYMNRLRAAGAENGFILEDQAEHGGLIVQSHYFHLFSIADDEALIIECAAPRQAKYWSVQIINPLCSTVEFVMHQSSLNNRQAEVDRDARLRMVLSLEDPQVPNWLDPAGWHDGGLQWRWNDVDAAPQPSVTKVKLHQIGTHLPAETPHVDCETRRAILAARTGYYQSRRR